MRKISFLQKVCLCHVQPHMDNFCEHQKERQKKQKDAKGGRKDGRTDPNLQNPLSLNRELKNVLLLQAFHFTL